MYSFIVTAYFFASHALADKSAASGWPPSTKSCDVLIAGGSTAALAAAITAAEAQPHLFICLTEPTDWLGGQMTSSGVSAFDFGTYNRIPANQPASFQDMMLFLEKNEPRDPACWVSIRCFDPSALVKGWIRERVQRLKNLLVMYRTMVSMTTTSSSSQQTNVKSLRTLHLIQRMAKEDVDEWDTLLSDSLQDWYSPIESSRFYKRWLNISAAVFVDATEWGDVLMTAGLDVGQGAERPTELSRPGGEIGSNDDQCGQAATLTFYMELLNKSPSVPDPAPPGSTADGAPFSTSGCCCPTSGTATTDMHTHGVHQNLTLSSMGGKCDYRTIWSYRRAVAGPSKRPALSTATSQLSSKYFDVNVGDISQQNWGNPSGNDLDNGYLFLPLSEAREQLQSGHWCGGINMTVLKMLEDRSYGWFHFYSAAFPKDMQPRLVLNKTATGTTTGLSKMPYVRDSRRSVGLQGYRLTHRNQTAPHATAKIAARPFDAVALGNYPADDHSVDTCHMPAYMSSAATVPYYVPFRALTHRDADNLLVAGKTSAATFYANSALRLHPSEWSTGVAAGAAAVLSVVKGQQSGRTHITTAEILSRWIPDLQETLKSLGAPVEWSDV